MVLVTALCGDLVAVVTSVGYGRLTVPLYNIAGSEPILQSTLTCTLDDRDTESSTNKADGEVSLCKLVLLPNFLCAWLSSNRVVVWNLSRGVVVHKALNLHGHRVLDVATASNVHDNDDEDETSLFVLVVRKDSKLYINEHSLETGRIVKKVKGGKMGSGHGGSNITTDDTSITQQGGLALSTNYFLVQTPGQWKLLQRQDGHRVTKQNIDGTGPSSTAVALHEQPGSLIVATHGAGNTVVLHKTNKKNGQTNKLATMVIPDTPRVLRLFPNVNGLDDDDDKNSKKAKNTKSMPLLLVQCDKDQTARICPVREGALSGGTTLQRRNTDSGSTETVQDVLYTVADEQKQQLVGVFLSAQNKTTILVESFEADGDTKTRSLPDTIEFGPATASTGKRKAEASANDDGAIKTLGPGQAGGEALKVQDEQPTKKKTKKQKKTADSTGKAEDGADDDEDKTMTDKPDGQDDTDGPTIAERLSSISKAMEDDDDDDDDDGNDDVDEDGNTDKSQSRKQQDQSKQTSAVTTESLAKLLQQALQSQDEAILEMALQSPRSIVGASLRELPDESCTLLLTHLTARLARKPARASQLVPWLQHLLPRIRSTQHLVPLQNLVQQRVENFGSLLQLEGRLSMLANI